MLKRLVLLAALLFASPAQAFWEYGHETIAEIAMAKRTVAALCGRLAAIERTPSPIDTVLDTALITAPAHRDPGLAFKLEAILKRVSAAG